MAGDEDGAYFQLQASRRSSRLPSVRGRNILLVAPSMGRLPSTWLSFRYHAPDILKISLSILIGRLGKLS
jgi:hypothetical protein